MRDAPIILFHQPCSNPACGSSDAVAVYANGQSHCFSCNEHLFDVETNGKEGRKKMTQDIIPMDSLTLEPLRARGISSETCAKYGYFTSIINGDPVQVASYSNDTGVIGQKIRTKDKTFSIRGGISDCFFGQHLFSGGKKLVVTEGEIDCLTVSQVQGNKWPVVSIPCGSQSASKTFKAQMEWLSTFEEVIVMFDMDKAGQDAVQAVSGILKPGQLKIAKLPLKDPNECLLAGKADAIINAIWRAQPYRPDGIINGSELWDILEAEEDEVQSYSYPWCDLPIQQMTQGIRRSEMLMITAGTGTGKTTFVKQLSYHLGVTCGLKIGLMHLEENKKLTAKGLMSIHVGKRLHLEKSVKDYKQAFDDVLGHGNFIFYDHFGSIEGENLLEKMRFLAVAEGCDFIVLDHISIAISGLEGSDERRIIDRMMTQLRSLVEETGVGLIIISHLRKSEGETSHEEGAAISMDQLRGSGTLKQIPDRILALERNQQDEDPVKRNQTRLRMLKDRWTGETGIAGYLQFDKVSGVLHSTTSTEVKADNGIKMDKDGVDF